jgi:hypothetical protein
MEHNSVIKKNEITSLARKWIELELTVLNEKVRLMKTNTSCSFSYAGSRCIKTKAYKTLIEKY